MGEDKALRAERNRRYQEKLRAAKEEQQRKVEESLAAQNQQIDEAQRRHQELLDRRQAEVDRMKTESEQPRASQVEARRQQYMGEQQDDTPTSQVVDERPTPVRQRSWQERFDERQRELRAKMYGIPEVTVYPPVVVEKPEPVPPGQKTAEQAKRDAESLKEYEKQQMNKPRSIGGTYNW